MAVFVTCCLFNRNKNCLSLSSYEIASVASKQMGNEFKGIAYPKMYILSSFMVTNLCELLMNTEEDILKNVGNQTVPNFIQVPNL